MLNVERWGSLNVITSHTSTLFRKEHFQLRRNPREGLVFSADGEVCPFTHSTRSRTTNSVRPIHSIRSTPTQLTGHPPPPSRPLSTAHLPLPPPTIKHQPTSKPSLSDSPLFSNLYITCIVRCQFCILVRICYRSRRSRALRTRN